MGDASQLMTLSTSCPDYCTLIFQFAWFFSNSIEALDGLFLKRSPTTCGHMDGPEGHDAKRSDTERQLRHGPTYKRKKHQRMSGDPLVLQRIQEDGQMLAEEDTQAVANDKSY